MYPSTTDVLSMAHVQGKYDSNCGSSSGSNNSNNIDAGDEAGTLFNFDEENYVSEGHGAAERDKRTFSIDGSLESSSDVYTWVGSFSDQQGNYSTRNSIDTKWRSPSHAANVGMGIRSPPINFVAPASNDYVSSSDHRPQASPSMNGYSASIGRRGVNASPGVSPFPRTSVDIGRFGNIGLNTRSSDSGFKLPPAIENHHSHLLPTEQSPSTLSPHVLPPANASPLFLPGSDPKNIWGAPDMNIGVSLFRDGTGCKRKKIINPI
ncbi:hypothetical protein BDR26DRAFT_428842 [Obelidium mucronatum]|nr:hypothetical protein BDR26DRAFT_428842 [Obelidium mucronatum]